MPGYWRSGLMAVCLIAAACTPSGGAPRTSTTPLTFPASAGEPNLFGEEERLEALIPLTARLRDLDFLEPIEVRIMEADEYSDRVGELVRGDLSEVAPEQKNAWARLFGLVPAGVDIDAVRAQILASQVATYDPDSSEIIVHPAFGVDSYVESVVVHELVHALHDQHFDLAPPPELIDDAAYILMTLREGDAIRIERRFIGTLGLSRQYEFERGRLNVLETDPDSTAPPYVIEVVTRPGEDGLNYVDVLSNGEIDAVLSRPPPTSEGILHPGAAEPARGTQLEPISALPYQPLPPQVLGEAQLRLLLEQGVGEITAAVAAGGWGGDQLRVQVLDDEVLFAYLFEGDTVADAEELATAFRLFLDRQLPGSAHGSVRIDADRVLVLAASDAQLEGQLDDQFDDFGAEIFSEPTS